MKNVEETLKNIILEKVIPEVSNITVEPKKQAIKNIDIEDGQNLQDLTKTLSKISVEHSIDIDKIYVGVEQDYDGGKFCAYFDTIVDKTPKEIENELIQLFDRKAWKIIFDTMVHNGFRRVGFNSGLLKDFDDTSVYQMIKDNAIDRLVNYYAFRYVAI